MGTLVIRHQIRAPDRPAAVRYPVPRLEVVRIERSAEPSPAVRAAAKVAGSRLIEVFVMQPDIVALVERLRRAVAPELAGFEQDHTERLTVEFPRQADSGRTCTNDADVRF